MLGHLGAKDLQRVGSGPAGCHSYWSHCLQMESLSRLWCAQPHVPWQSSNALMVISCLLRTPQAMT